MGGARASRRGSTSKAKDEGLKELGASAIGRRLTKHFDGEPYGGEVVEYLASKRWYLVTYDDGDREDMLWSDLSTLLVDETASGSAAPAAEAPESTAATRCVHNRRGEASSYPSRNHHFLRHPPNSIRARWSHAKLSFRRSPKGPAPKPRPQAPVEDPEGGTRQPEALADPVRSRSPGPSAKAPEVRVRPGALCGRMRVPPA